MLDVQLKIFRAIVEQKSFSKAAEVLHMTQSSVSQQIQHLEEYYGVKLFDRFYRRIRTTPAGEALYPYAIAMDRLQKEAEKTMQGFAAEIGGKLNLGASLTIGEYVLPPILVAFQKIYPQVGFSMEVCNTEAVMERVRTGKVNIGFIEGPFTASEQLVSNACGGDRLIVVAGRQAAVANRVSLEDVLAEKWIMRNSASGTRAVFENFIQEHGSQPAALNVVMELESTQAIKEAVKAGLGISVVSDKAVAAELASGDLKALELQEGKIRRPFTMLYHKSKFRTQAAELFSAFVLQTLNFEEPDQDTAENTQ